MAQNLKAGDKVGTGSLSGTVVRTIPASSSVGSSLAEGTVEIRLPSGVLCVVPAKDVTNQ